MKKIDSLEAVETSLKEKIDGEIVYVGITSFFMDGEVHRADFDKHRKCWFFRITKDMKDNVVKEIFSRRIDPR